MANETNSNLSQPQRRDRLGVELRRLAVVSMAMRQAVHGIPPAGNSTAGGAVLTMELLALPTAGVSVRIVGRKSELL